MRSRMERHRLSQMSQMSHQSHYHQSHHHLDDACALALESALALVHACDDESSVSACACDQHACDAYERALNEYDDEHAHACGHPRSHIACRWMLLQCLVRLARWH